MTTKNMVAPQSLLVAWPTNARGFVLQQNSDLTTTNWVNATNAVSVVGTNSQVTIPPLTDKGFFPLLHR